VANATDDTRVHVIATHFNPEYAAYSNLAVVREPELRSVPAVLPAPSVYLAQRDLSDEHRYILVWATCLCHTCSLL